MTDQQQQAESPIPATEAQVKMDALTADPAWVDRLMQGDTTAKNEFFTLSAAIVGGGSADDVVASVMDGKAPAFGNGLSQQMAGVVEQFRAIGIDDGVTKQFLSGHQVTPQEYQAAANLKRELMGDSEWVSKFMGGDVKARQRMTIINAVLVNGVKMEAQP